MTQILCVAVVIITGIGFVTPILPPISKIDPPVLQIFQEDTTATVNIFVEMREGNENILWRIDSTTFSSRSEKISTLKRQLESLAKASQNRILSILEEGNADFISFWINNRVYVRNANLELVERLTEDPEILFIREEQIIYRLPEQIISTNNNTIKGELPWGLEKIEAPQAWNLDCGNRGEGVVVAIIDAGVRSTHADLHANFRDDYGWFDPYNMDPIPSDMDALGTCLAGALVGENGIGVAPGAKWIACRGCDADSCDEFALTACGQWIVCPTLPNGTNPDCNKAPQITSNSWGGRAGSSNYVEMINAWHSAGIIPIFGVGDEGPDCGSTVSPGDLDNVIGVGATRENDTIASISSRGPAANGLLKPDIVAPGIVICPSAMADNEYMIAYGSGMACAHVSGVVALLLARNASLSFEEVKKLLLGSTDLDLGEAEDCGGSLPPHFPNNVYGHGRLNARKALEALLEGSEGCNNTSASNSTFLINLVFSLAVLIMCALLVPKLLIEES